MGIVIKFFCVVIFAGFLCLDAQNLNLIYEVHSKSSKNDTIRNVDLMQLTIDTKTNESLYESYEERDNNSLTDIEKMYNEILRNQKQNFFDKIYKNIDLGINYKFYSISNKFYRVQYNPISENWNIVKEEKLILNNLCHKATINWGGRVWEAWYAVKIPIPNGPDKFSGLPGLILEINSKDGDYQIVIKELIKKDIEKINFPKFIELSENKFKKISENFISDPSLYLRQLYSKSNFVSEATFNGKELKVDNEYFNKKNKEFWDWMKNHNNPIEKGEIWLK